MDGSQSCHFPTQQNSTGGKKRTVKRGGYKKKVKLQKEKPEC